MCAIVVRRWSWIALTLLLTGAMVMADTVVVKPDKAKPDTVTYTGMVTKIAEGKLHLVPSGGSETTFLLDVVETMVVETPLSVSLSGAVLAQSKKLEVTAQGEVRVNDASVWSPATPTLTWRGVLTAGAPTDPSADEVVIKDAGGRPNVVYRGKLLQIVGGKAQFEVLGFGKVSAKLTKVLRLTVKRPLSVFVPRCGKPVGNQGFPESGVVSLDRTDTANQRLTVDGNDYLFADDNWLRQLRVGADEWKCEVSLAYTGKFGDTENTVAEGKATFSRDVYLKRDRVEAKAVYDDSGDEIQRAFGLEVSDARDWTGSSFYRYWLLNLDRDERQAYALRTAGSVGVGYRWVDDSESFDIYLGPQYVNTDYQAGAVEGDGTTLKVDASELAAIAGVAWTRTVGTVEITGKARAQGLFTDDSRLYTGELKVAIPISDSWKLTLSDDVAWNPTPADGKHEINQTAKIGVTFPLK